MPHPYLTRVIAGQLSRFTRYYDAVVQFAPLPNDDGALLETGGCPPPKPWRAAIHGVPAAAPFPPAQRNAILLNGNLNHDLDIEARSRSSRG